MTVFGTFATNTSALFSPRIIYQPSRPTVVSVASQPIPIVGTRPILPQPISTRPSVPLTVSPTPVITDVQSPAGTTTGQTSPPAVGGGTATGTAGDGNSSSDPTSRLFDLISGAFQPQSIGQTYGPTAVDNTGGATSTTGGTNPMAVVVLAILVIAGVFWYAHRKTGRAS